MSDPRITIKFRADGAAALQKAIRALAVEQKRLEKGNAAAARMQKKLNRQIDEYNKLGIFGVRNTRNLSFSLSVLRSKLLIAAFGFATINKSLGSFVRAQGEQELAEKKLEQALGKVNKGLLGQASALQQVTAFGDETIISAQALLAAFVKDEDQLKKATEATLDLAAAKGMDLASAADLVGKTLGSSTNSLSRYGIEVEGAVGSTGRLNTLVNSIANAFGGQAKAQADTLTGSIEQMQNAIGDTSEAIGALMAPAVINIAKSIKSAAESFSDFFKSISETNAETSVRKLNELGAGTLALEKQILEIEILRAEKSTQGLEDVATLETRRNIELNQQKFNLNKIFDLELKLEKQYGSVARAREFAIGTGEEDQIRIDLEQLKIFEKRQEQSENYVSSLNEQIGLQQDLIDKKNNLNLIDNASNKISKETKKVTEDTFSMLGDFGDFQLPIPFIDNSEIERIERIKALMDDINKKNEENKKTQEGLKALEEAREALQFKMATGILKIAGAATKSAEAQKNIAFGLAMIDAFKIYTSTKRNLTEEGVEAAKANQIALAESILAAGYAVAIRAQKFETGGLVGGRRHSQGGTLIEAERGEFVMSRNAVQSIGVDNLEAMNQGGSAVNITITGNVMTSDFVEGELAEKIRDAVRTGTDFGMS